MSALFSTPKAPKAPQPIDPGQSAGEFLFGRDFSSSGGITDPEMQRRLLLAESTYRPEYANLDLQSLQQMMFGSSEQSEIQRQNKLKQWIDDNEAHPWYQDMLREQLSQSHQRSLGHVQAGPVGGLDLLDQATARISQIEGNAASAQRARDIQDVENLGPRAAEAFLNANPELRQSLEASQGMAGPQNTAALQALEAQALAGIGGAAGANTPTQGRLSGKGPAPINPLGDVAHQSVQPGSVAAGALGDQLQQMALNAGPSATTQALGRQAETLANSQGRLNAMEMRDLEQQARQAGVARGREMDSSSMAREMGDRIEAQRDRYFQDLNAAAALNQQQLGAQEADRGFRMGVQGQDQARQFGNLDRNMQGQIYNAQSRTATDFANRDFRANQQQQNFANLGAAANMRAGQTAADRQYQLALTQSLGGLASDPFLAILGRPSGASQMAAGQQMMGNQMLGNLGPALFDPNAGINMALGQQANMANYAGNVAAGQGAMFGGLMGGLGQLGGGMFCWVAREVYGAEDPRWLLFRRWMLEDAPGWFRGLYVGYGERFAGWIRNKPRIKGMIRWWMDTKTKGKTL